MSISRTCLLALFASTQWLSASDFGISFHFSGATTGDLDPANPPVIQGSVVDTAATTWHTIDAGGQNNPAPFGTINLPNGVTVSGSGGWSQDNGIAVAANNKDWVMMNGWIGFKETETLTIANIPTALQNTGYRVAIYGDSNTTNRTMHYTLGGTTKTIIDSANFSGTFTDGANFVEFDGLNASSFTIVGNQPGTSGRSAINGILIVPDVDTPEVVSFDTDDTYVSSGQSATLSWQTQHATTVELDAAPVALNGSLVVSPTTTTTYTLRASANGLPDAVVELTIHVGPPRPNILLFIVDDMGWQDTSVPFHHDAAGTPIITSRNTRYRTPNMETLATQGMKFSNACAFPVCTPTRTSILTGLHAARHRVTTWTNRNTPSDTASIPAGSPMRHPPSWAKAGMSDELRALALPQLLKDAGYRTIQAGKAHFGPNSTVNGNPLNHGFDVNIGGDGGGSPGSGGYYGTNNFGAVPGPQLNAYHGQDIFLTEALTLEINKEIENSVNAGQPFFACMSHYAVHAPFLADARFTANYPSLSGSQLAFATLIEGMDKSLGDILAKLNALGVSEDTLVIFMGDNGSDSPQGTPSLPLSGKKGHAKEGGNRVPLIAAWATPNPANTFQSSLSIPQGSLETDIVTCMDIYPTVLDVAAVPFIQPIDGLSLLPYFRADPGTHRPQEFLVHFPHPHQYEDFYGSLRQDSWKLIWRYVDGIDDWQLYDLATDIDESDDLFANTTHQPQLISMARQFARQLVEMDALYAVNVNGSVPKPPIMPDFPAVDTDGDGISDTNEDPNRNGIRDSSETDPDLLDTDADGTGDGAEVATGTDPLNPSSSFTATLDSSTGDTILSWPSAPGSTFDVQCSQTLDANDWQDVFTDVAASAAESFTSVIVDPVGSGRRFYRVVLNP